MHDELTVGRGGGCGIVLDDTFVSQVHARVFRRDGDVYVEDLGFAERHAAERPPASAPRNAFAVATRCSSVAPSPRSRVDMAVT